PALRAHATVDRAIIARNTHQDLRDASLPADVGLLFWSPGSIELQKAAGRDATHESCWESNVRAALYEGMPVHLLLPRVRDVQFIRSYRPLRERERFAIYRADGHLKVVDEGGLRLLLAGMPGSE